MLSELNLKKFYDAADTIAGISAGSGLIGGIYDAITAQHRSQDAMNYGIGMYKMQRADALSDWNMQNQYNSPKSVMDRYKAAGLNPNLIYGSQGLQSPSVRASSTMGYPVAPSTAGRDVASSIQKYQDTRLVAAQVDQTKQAMVNLQQDNLLKQADLVKKSMENIILSTDPRTSIDPLTHDWASERAKSLINLDVQTKEQQFENLQVYGDLSIAQVTSQRIKNAVDAATQQANITVGLQKGLQSLIDTSKDAIEKKNLEILQSKMLNEVELQKLEMGIQGGDLNARSPFYQKLLSGLIDGAMLLLGRSTPQQRAFAK